MNNFSKVLKLECFNTSKFDNSHCCKLNDFKFGKYFKQLISFILLYRNL